MASKNKTTIERLRHAYGLLGSAELGRWCEWTGPKSGPYLATRVKLLAALGNALPRAKAEHWEQAVEAWISEFSPGSVVSFADLREVALRVLRPITPEQSAVQEPGESRGGLARQVLEQWRSEVLHSSRWTHLTGVIPGEASIPLEEVFVELTAIPREDADKFESDGGPWAAQLSRRKSRADGAISALAMATRTLEQCVVLGAPGSGKSTLVQWLTRAIAKGECPDFEAGIVVKLSVFAEALRQRPRLSLLKFFCESLERQISGGDAAVSGLRSFAKQSRRLLLLLDGWDEVPPVLRDQVLAKIHQEQPYFITLITSRPAGLPRQLAGVVKTDFYEIAGLAPKAIQQLASRLLATRGAADLAESVLRKLEADADLLDLAQNPFLLGLLVRVMLRGRDAVHSPSLAGIFAQVTAWLEEQYEQARGAAPPLRRAHWLGLQRLSYELLFERTNPTYLFSLRDLSHLVNEESTVPVERSRLVNRQHLVYDEYGFVHATFQEYFAAQQLSELDEETWRRAAERGFLSASRLIVLEFVAGLPGARGERLQKCVASWLAQPDRFGQVLLKAARLAGAGKWRDGAVAEAIRTGLWRQIVSNDELAPVKDAVMAYVRLDAWELCERVKSVRDISLRVVTYLVESLPKELLTKLRQRDLLSGAARNSADPNTRQPVTPREDAAIPNSFASPPSTFKVDSVSFVGVARVVRSSEELQQLVRNPEVRVTLREDALDGLAQLGDRGAVDLLVDVVCGEVPFSTSGMRVAAGALRNTAAGRKALDPPGRDRLLRRMALTPPSAPHWNYLLEALEGHPLREGGELVAECLTRRDYTEAAAEQATRTLASVMDRELVAGAVTRLETESRRKVQLGLLDLAVTRRLPVSFTWLEGEISQGRGRVDMLQLLKRYVQLLLQGDEGGGSATPAALHAFVVQALGATGGEEQETRAKSLASAITAAATHWELDPETEALAASVLREFVQDSSEMAEGRALLAAALGRRFRTSAAVSVLRSALDAALALPESTSQRRMRLASALAQSLVDCGPAELLAYPSECEPVRLVLQSAVLERGWMVYDDRILSAEGVLVCRAREAPPSNAGPAPQQRSCWKLGDEPARTLALLVQFYRIGREYVEGGAKSLGEISNRFKSRGVPWACSKAALTKHRQDIETFFAEQEGAGEPVFHRPKAGAAITGLSERGLHLWRKTEQFLREYGALE